MIKVDRNASGIPDSLHAVGGAGDRERARARRHYMTGKKESFNFSAYKGDDVVTTLKSAFNGKCAYCESKILHVAPPDIEHFRPKGEVTEDDTHPGYWWLAADWENLLLSCRDCNASRYHTVLEAKSGSLTGTVLLAGKHCSFPVNGTYRAMSHADNYLDEDPLLIDPTIKDPQNHLTWTLEHGSALAAPRSPDNIVDVYGDTSVKGYALNRSELVQARVDHANGLIKDIINIKKQVGIITKSRSLLDVTIMVELLASMVDALNDKADASAQFSSFSRYVIDENLREIADDIKELFESL